MLQWINSPKPMSLNHCSRSLLFPGAIDSVIAISNRSLSYGLAVAQYGHAIAPGLARLVNSRSTFFRSLGAAQPGMVACHWALPARSEVALAMRQRPW